MRIIGHIYTDFPEKFGIPRQSGLVEGLRGRVVFEPEFRQPEAVRGLEEFSHIWLLWKFSESRKENWSATVQPPRLGGKKRVGVFASRSPFRPNDIGLSCVRLIRIERDEEQGLALLVDGVDMMDGTPLYDIKPYIPVSDCHPDAREGYTQETKRHRLQVVFPGELLARYPEDKRAAALEVLALDPRPTYFQAPGRLYGVSFAGFDIKFTVDEEVLTVHDVVDLKSQGDDYEKNPPF